MLVHTFTDKLVILIQWESESVVFFFLSSFYGTGFSHPRSHQARATFASEIREPGRSWWDGHRLLLSSALIVGMFSLGWPNISLLHC